MTTELATPKQGWLLSFSTGDKIRVILDKSKGDPNRASMKQNKEIVMLDRNTMDFTYFVLAKPFDLNKSAPKDVESWIDELPQGMREVAEYISEQYSISRSVENQKVTIKFSDLKKRIDNFIKNGKLDDYKKMYKIYISNGGNPDLISANKL